MGLELMISTSIAEAYLKTPWNLVRDFNKYSGIYKAQQLSKEFLEVYPTIFDDYACVNPGSKFWFGRYKFAYEPWKNTDTHYLVYENRIDELFNQDDWIISEDPENVLGLLANYFKKSVDAHIPKDYYNLISNGWTLKRLNYELNSKYHQPDKVHSKSKLQKFISYVFPNFTDLIYLSAYEYRMVNPTVMDLVHYVNRYLQGKDSIEIFRDNLENIYDDANDINRELKSIPIVENIIRSSSEMLGAVKLTLMG